MTASTTDAAGPLAGGRRVVAVGGGHGLAATLRALRELSVAPTAVVTVADDGGSSGRLRADLGIIPPGDLRMALLTLARREDLAAALAHRFAAGDLEGHALGNLLLVALAEQSGGDFVVALERAAALLDCAGRVYPCTAEPVVLRGLARDGRRLDGQVTVATAEQPLDALWLEPRDPAACPEAVKALDEAEVVVLGPGSLFTSVIPNLLVPGVADALRRSAARLVYVANLTTQPGETAGMELAAHVEALLGHLPGGALDVVVAHDGPEAGGPGEPLGAGVTRAEVGRLVAADLARPAVNGTVPHGHDPTRLAMALAPLLVPYGASPAR